MLPLGGIKNPPKLPSAWVFCYGCGVCTKHLVVLVFGGYDWCCEVCGSLVLNFATVMRHSQSDMPSSGIYRLVG